MSDYCSFIFSHPVDYFVTFCKVNYGLSFDDGTLSLRDSSSGLDLNLFFIRSSLQLVVYYICVHFVDSCCLYHRATHSVVHPTSHILIFVVLLLTRVQQQ